MTQSQKAANRKLSGVVATMAPAIVILVRAAEIRHVSIKRVHSSPGETTGTRKKVTDDLNRLLRLASSRRRQRHNRSRDRSVSIMVER